MFGIEQGELIDGLRKVGNRTCGYGPLGVFPRRCDCKYGADRRSEDTGCPEVALALAFVEAMTPAEYKRIAKRAGVLL